MGKKVRWKSKWIAGVLSFAMVVTVGGVLNVSKDAAAADEDTKFTDILTASDLSDLRFTWSDKSNVGEAHDVTLSDETVLSVKDNGSVRPDLASQTLVDTELGVGINLGNTLEAVIEIKDENSKKNVTGTQYDRAWGQPVTTRALIDAYHSYGINTLRIPVAWSNGDWDDGTYTIQGALLDRVETIVNYALDNGMYVIINDHWDNQWWGQFGACKKAEDGTKVADEETRANAWVRYERYWTQIAERFKGYSDHLIFEGANEELGDRLNDPICLNGPAKGYCKQSSQGKEIEALGGNLTNEECYATANKINQFFVDTIRKSGGNNEQRFLMIPGINTNMGQTADAKFVMPTDPKEQNGVKKLLLSVHCYTPQSFALDNGSGDYTLADRKALEKEFADLQKFSDAGYGTIVGECGFCNPAGVSGSVTQWFYDVYKLAQKYHATPVLWDTGAWFDRDNAVLVFKDFAEFWNTVNQANGDTSMEKTTGGAAAPVVEDSTMGAYLDKELWGKKGLHAYMFYQTANWDYRNAYKPLGKLNNKEHSWEWASAMGVELTTDVKVTDAYITGDGVYTVGLSGTGLSGNTFRMLGISTDINQKLYGADIKVTDVSVKLDGVEQTLDTTEAPIKKDDTYSDFMIINVYDKEGTTLPLGKLNENEEIVMPMQSVEISFKISGLSKAISDLANGTYIDPETNETIKVDLNGSSASSKNACKKVAVAKKDKSVTISRGKSRTITFNLTNTKASKKTTDKISVKSSIKKVTAKVTKKTAKKVTVKVTVNKKAKKGAKATITLTVGKKSAKATVKVK